MVDRHPRVRAPERREAAAPDVGGDVIVARLFERDLLFGERSVLFEERVVATLFAQLPVDDVCDVRLIVAHHGGNLS